MSTAPPAGPLVTAGTTSEITTVLDDPAAFLTAVELARAQRLRSRSDRADFQAAHGLVRLVAARVLGCAARDLTVVQRCAQCGPGHGRPTITEAPSLSVSWSHTRGFVAAIAGFGPVAVDVEHPPRGVLDAALLGIALSPAERAGLRSAADPGYDFARRWVRKESLVKLGLATLDTLANADLGRLAVEPAWSAGPPGRRLTWRAWHLVEWSHRGSRTVGTAIAGVAAQLTDARLEAVNGCLAHPAAPG